jgi:hypothetical protein
MTDKITFGDLHRLLEECGFEQSRVNGPYIVFHHGASGALQAFRAHRAGEQVDPMTLASVRKTLVGFGFLDEGAFEGAVRKAAGKRTARAKRG